MKNFKTMKYYLQNDYGFRKEISKESYYSLRRRKNAHETICYQNGHRSSRILKFY